MQLALIVMIEWTIEVEVAVAVVVCDIITKWVGGKTRHCDHQHQ